MALLILVKNFLATTTLCPQSPAGWVKVSESRTQGSSAKTAILDYAFLEQRRD